MEFMLVSTFTRAVFGIGTRSEMVVRMEGIHGHIESGLLFHAHDERHVEVYQGDIHTYSILPLQPAFVDPRVSLEFS